MNPSIAVDSGADIASQASAGLAATLAHTPSVQHERGARSDERQTLTIHNREIRTKIVQRVDDPSPERANAQARDDLANGAEGLAIVFEGAPNAFGNGLPATPEALSGALNDVPLTRTHIRLDVHPQSRASVDWLVQILTARRISPDKLDISFGIDPAALFAGTGRLRMSIEAMHASMPQSLAHFFALGVPGILIEADGRVFHNAGASDVQELGIMLASAMAYLRMFEEARQPVLYAAAHIGFATSLDQNHSRSVAKLRALRRLWARLLEGYAIAAADPVIHAETSYRSMMSRSPETNLARGVLAASAAIEAGVKTFAPLPHTLPLEFPDASARRLARDTVLVLASEGNLASVTDGPESEMEALVSFLCDAAWDELQTIESEGGILRSVLDGRLQARIVETRNAYAERLREGHVPIVGTTLHPASGSTARSIASTVEATTIDDGTITCEKLQAVRLEEMLEETQGN